MQNYSRSLKKARPRAQRAETTSRVVKSTLSRPMLVRLYTAWRRDCQIAQHSPRTLDNCKKVFDLFLWFPLWFSYPKKADPLPLDSSNVRMAASRFLRNRWAKLEYRSGPVYYIKIKCI